MAVSSSDFWDVDAILASETLAPARLVSGITGCGTIIDPSSDSNELVAGAVVEMPVWLIRSLAQRNMVQPELPIYYRDKMRRKMKAGAGVEELKVRCPYYYTVGRELHSAMQATLTADETFPIFIMNSLRKRYKELLVKGPVVESSQEFSAIQSKLSCEEVELFVAAREAALAHAAWVDPNSHRALLNKAGSLKRKWDDNVENQPVNQQQQQRR
ncbi:hypothetical protein N2152v2_009786 [Parachlorella kessleri]